MESRSRSPWNYLESVLPLKVRKQRVVVVRFDTGSETKRPQRRFRMHSRKCDCSIGSGDAENSEDGEKSELHLDK